MNIEVNLQAVWRLLKPVGSPNCAIGFYPLHCHGMQSQGIGVIGRFIHPETTRLKKDTGFSKIILVDVSEFKTETSRTIARRAIGIGKGPGHDQHPVVSPFYLRKQVNPGLTGNHLSDA